MFAAARLVDKATSNDDQPVPGIVLAESVQLARSNSAAVSKLVGGTVKKLDSQLVQVRIKALKFLQHLVQNGPPSVQAEIKLYSSKISECMAWRGLPHPTKGYEAYNEMKDIAQSVLDTAFATQQRVPASFAVSNAPAAGRSMQETPVYSNMEAFGSGPVNRYSASLEPRNLDPNAGNEVVDFIKDLFMVEKKPPPVSKYGAVSSDRGIQQTYQAAGSQPAPNLAPRYGGPPSRGQFDRLEADANWTTRQPELAPKKKATQKEVTAVTKLLNVSSGRSAPTKSELTVFNRNCNASSIVELEDGLKASDWKVRLRSVAGLEVCGEKFGLGAIAHLKGDLESLKKSPQASLRTAASKLLETLDGVEPTGIPEEPSAFDFVSSSNNQENSTTGDDTREGTQEQENPSKAVESQESEDDKNTLQEDADTSLQEQSNE